MSLLIRNYMEPFDCMNNVFDSLLPLNYFNNFGDLSHSFYTRPKKNKKHVITLNVDCFKPEELNVAIENGKILISGKHESNNQQGSDKREFTRYYDVPEGYDEKTLKYRLNSQGVLTVTLDMTKAVKQFDPLVVDNDQMLSITMNVSGFQVDDLSISLDGNYLLVTGQKGNQQQDIHQDASHHSTNNLYFSQKFLLRNDVDREKISVDLDPNGNLSIKAMKDPNRTPSIKKLQISTSS